MKDKLASQEINVLRKKIKDLEAQKQMLRVLITEYVNKGIMLKNMTWIPNVVPGVDELHFQKWKAFSLAANKKALNELQRQAIVTQKHLKSLQKKLTQLQRVKK